jgi:Arc/MetJ-type ribon-helix-helix transcriptional regulator
MGERFDGTRFFVQMKGMNVALAKDVEEFLEEQMRTGACSEPSALINDAVRALARQRKQPFAITPELEAWLLEAADSPVSPLTHGDFDGIRERVRARRAEQP